MLRPLSPALAAGLLAGAPVPAPPARGFPRTEDVHILECAAAGQAPASYLIELDGTCIGTLGAVGIPTCDGEQEIGYGLIAPARRRGLGTEAVAALCAALERQPGLSCLSAQVHPQNTASMALLRRLGFVPVPGASRGHLKFARAAAGKPPLRARIVGRHVC